jgi:broad specificity phosphatase PhoE
MKASDEIAALDESAKRLRLYMAVLSAVAEGRQTLSPDAAGHIRDELARLTAELEAVRAERDRAMQSCEQIAVRLGERRMCLNCGKTRAASEPKDDLPECTSPEFPGLAACTWDATPDEAWQIWRDRAYQARAERGARIAPTFEAIAAWMAAEAEGCRSQSARDCDASYARFWTDRAEEIEEAARAVAALARLAP